MAPLANERLLPLLLLAVAAGTAMRSSVVAVESGGSASTATTTTTTSTATTTALTMMTTVKILAVFDQADMETMERVMQKTLTALNKEKTAWTAASGNGGGGGENASSAASPAPWYNGKRRKEWLAGRLAVDSVAFSSQWWANQTADDLGRLIASHRPVAVLALSADEHSVFRVALAASTFHLPVIGARAQRGLDDSSFRGVSPLYVGLNPGPHHLASALHHLLLANNWLPVTLIVDDSLDAQKIRQVVQQHPSDAGKVMVVTVNRGSPPHRILAQLSGIQQTTSLVIAFCCEPRLASLIFREARRLNMLNGDWVWLALEQAVGRWNVSPSPPTELTADWPLGLLGLVSQQPHRLTKHTMKGALAILHSAIRAGLPVHQLPTWLSSWNDSTSSSISTNVSSLPPPPPEQQQQQRLHPIRLQVAKKLDSEIRWRVKEALAGRLTYDGGGKIDSALRANFDVINLVPPGPFYPGTKSTKTTAPRTRRHVASQPRFGNNITADSAKRTDSAVSAVAESRTDGQALEDEDEDEDEDGQMQPSEDTGADFGDANGDGDDGDDQQEWMSPVAISSGQASAQNSGGGASSPNELNAIKDVTMPRPPIWRSVGNVSGQAVTFKGVQWPGGGLAGPRSHSRRVYRVATIFSPPFVMETEVFKENDAEEEEQRCLTGVPCLRVATGQKDELARIFGDFEGAQLYKGVTYNLTCCYGYSIDLMENVASDLDVKFQVYVVADGQCGSKRASKWDGIVADLRSGAAHLSFAPLSVTSVRSEAIDFSIPYFYSGLSILEASKRHDDVPLLAFLKPFRPDLWIGIFISLNLTALAVAVYEWLSPFGLNPWGRQRTKNFSLASALWVMWGLLFSHLVAFKAPKSWPNKFLINVWGGFSVIFLASYTANIAALFAGVFSETAVTNFHDPRLLNQKVGTTRSSAAHHYALKTNRRLFEHLQRFTVPDLEEGIIRLRDGRLDLLIGDTPILDYYRANDPGCTLRTVDVIEEDNYAVGMTKGLRLQTSISSLISSYSTSGYMDELRSKWYSSLPCSRSAYDAYRPQPLGVSAVAGVFILLGFGILGGCLILILEHLVYKYALPVLRRQLKGTIWRSPNMMFFSQKLYRFINCVELLSPHHAAKELMHSLRQGQITSLFQKSVKRKEIEQKRRRKSKAQFFEMIREVRRYQQEEKEMAAGEDEDKDEVAAADAGEDVGDDDDEEEEEEEDAYHPAEETLSVVIVPGAHQAPSTVAFVDDGLVSDRLERYAYTRRATAVKHSASSFTDPGFFVDPSSSSSSTHQHHQHQSSSSSSKPSDSDRKWRAQTKRRRSFSADALCETAVHHQRRRHQGVRFAESSPSSSSNSSESLSQSDDGGVGANSDDDSSSLLCSMVDRATLNKLTKEDLLLLWQAAESEWIAKVRSLRKQRDILQLRYQHAKSEGMGSPPPPPPPSTPPPLSLLTMKF